MLPRSGNSIIDRFDDEERENESYEWCDICGGKFKKNDEVVDCGICTWCMNNGKHFDEFD